jgi:hypothetical protein
MVGLSRSALSPRLGTATGSARLPGIAWRASADKVARGPISIITRRVSASASAAAGAKRTGLRRCSAQ